MLPSGYDRTVLTDGGINTVGWEALVKLGICSANEGDQHLTPQRMRQNWVARRNRSNATSSLDLGLGRSNIYTTRSTDRGDSVVDSVEGAGDTFRTG